MERCIWGIFVFTFIYILYSWSLETYHSFKTAKIALLFSNNDILFYYIDVTPDLCIDCSTNELPGK